MMTTARAKARLVTARALLDHMIAPLVNGALVGAFVEGGVLAGAPLAAAGEGCDVAPMDTGAVGAGAMVPAIGGVVTGASDVAGVGTPVDTGAIVVEVTGAIGGIVVGDTGGLVVEGTGAIGGIVVGATGGIVGEVTGATGGIVAEAIGAMVVWLVPGQPQIDCTGAKSPVYSEQVELLAIPRRLLKSKQVALKVGIVELGFPGEAPFGHKKHSWTEPGQPQKKSKLVDDVIFRHSLLSDERSLTTVSI